MELVENLSSTNESDDLKECVTYKLIMKTVTQPMNSLECRKVLQRLTGWIINSEHKFLRENALKGFDALAENCFSVFQELVDLNYFKIIFANVNHTKPVNLIGLVITIFSKLGKNTVYSLYTSVTSSLILYLGHHGNNPTFLQSLEHLYMMFPALLPVSTQDATQLGSIVIFLHSSHSSTCQCDIRLDKLLSHVWTKCQDTGPCLHTLHTVFRVLSTPDTSCPPACLSTVLEAIPPDLLDQNLSLLLDQPPERLVLVLTRLFAWLEVRSAPSLTTHVLKLLSELGCARGSLVASVSQTCLVRLVQQVTEVISTRCRDQLAMLALVMLYGGQQSPASFQSIIPLLPEVIEVLAIEELWHTRDLLLECAQYHSALFPGVLTCSQLEIVLQEENLAQISDERRHYLVGQAWGYPGNIKLDRRTGQLVGLVNLGNTCYMNSVLQALFSTRMFQSQVVASRKSNAQPVLSSLQRVFRCLKMSKRSSVSPRQFLDISRPPWFDAGLQQDCSEFLIFLLHSLEEEIKMVKDETKPTTSDMQWENCGGDDEGKTAKKASEVSTSDDSGGRCNSSHDSGVDSGGEAGPIPSPSLVQAVFGGQLNIAYQCLECSNTSQVVTSFTELHLAIPSTRSPQAQSMPDLLPNLPHITITRARHLLTVTDLVSNYLAPEDLCGDNQYQCDKCEGLRDAVKTTQIKAAPKYLTISLLRFKFDASTCRKVKLLTPVECPQALSLPITEGEEVKYQLYCVVVHSGQSSEGGHYYTWVRDRQRVEWHRVSDEEVETVPGTLDQEGHSRRDTPYMLFYQREGLM